MMKPLLILTMLLYGAALQAHTISGKIYDRRTGEPVVGVVVYLDGTTIGVTTDIHGEFSLDVKHASNSILVMRHVSYETKSFPMSSVKDHADYYLAESNNNIGEVVVYDHGFTREELLEAFRDEFLGRTRAGKSCAILNEGALKLWFNNSTNTFHAQADTVLLIDNEFLGYRIEYLIRDFNVKYERRTISPSAKRVVQMAGTEFFIDKYPGRRTYLRRRKNVYEQSSSTFLRCIAYGVPSKTSFRVVVPDNQRQLYYPPFSELFTVQDTVGMKSVIFSPNKYMITNEKNSYGREPYGTMTVKSDGGISTIWFFTDKFLVDIYGVTDKPFDIEFYGYMGTMRMGDALPRDYVP